VIANSLCLEAQARGDRTVVTTIRGSGLLRASRPFREGGATRVVVAHLGPGMIRGDAFALGGRVEPGAHLIVAGQMATRVLSGPAPATHAAAWHVAAGATLELLPQPVLVSTGASYAGTTTLELEPGARAVVTELVQRDPGAAVRITTLVRRGPRLALADTLRLDGDDDATVVGTLLVLGDGDVGALDRAAERCLGVRVGIGVLRDGDVLARITGPGVREVDAALRTLLD
jgi:hypothetical protein